VKAPSPASENRAKLFSYGRELSAGMTFDTL